MQQQQQQQLEKEKEMYPSTRNLLSLNCDTLDDVLFPYFA